MYKTLPGNKLLKEKKTYQNLQIVYRKKTTTSSNVRLLDIPTMIIKKYAGLSKDGKVFSVSSDSYYNDRLKAIS